MNKTAIIFCAALTASFAADAEPLDQDAMTFFKAMKIELGPISPYYISEAYKIFTRNWKSKGKRPFRKILCSPNPDVSGQFEVDLLINIGDIVTYGGSEPIYSEAIADLKERRRDIYCENELEYAAQLLATAKIAAEEIAESGRAMDERKEADKKQQLLSREREAAKAIQSKAEYINKRRIELRSGKITPASISDVILLQNIDDGTSFVRSPPLGAQPGLFLLTARLLGRYGNALHFRSGLNDFTVELNDSTKWFDINVGQLRVNSEVSVIAKFLGVESRGGTSWARFEAKYIGNSQ